MELDHFRHLQQTGEEREVPFKTSLSRQSLIMKPDLLEYPAKVGMFHLPGTFL